MPEATRGTVWYISKYLAPPAPKSVGSRGFYLMRELAEAGYTTTIFTSDANHLATPPRVDGRYLRQNLSGVDVCWIRTLKYPTVRSVKRMLSWLHFELGLLTLPLKRFPKPDVVVASSLSLTSVLTGILLSRRYGARFVFEVRDIWPLTLTEEGGFSAKHPLIKLMAWVERLGYTRADAIVGTMPNLEAHVREVSKSTKPVHCIPMGYDEQPLEASGELPPAYIDAKVPANKFLVGYAGSVGTTNALETLFECAESMREDDSIHFVIVGSGDLLDDFIGRYGNLPNTTFVGSVPRESVQAVLAEFDVLYLSALPSKVWEFGQSLNKVIDYMLAGKPVIASYSGYPSMLNEAGGGVFVPAADAQALAQEVQRFAQLSDEQRLEMGERGRNWMIENRNYQHLADLYDSILFPLPGD